MTNEYAPPILPGCSVLPPLQPRPPRPIRDNTDDTEGNGERTRKGSAKRTAAGQRFKVVNTFVDFTLRTLRRNEIAVWLILWRDTRDGIARTAQADIARRAGITDRTVRRSIGKLERSGLVQVVRRGGINSGASTYRVRPLQPGG
jgi:predicted DNA-binding transcriptional regulator